MKKIISMLLALTLCLTVCACSKSDDSAETVKETTTAAAETDETGLPTVTKGGKVFYKAVVSSDYVGTSASQDSLNENAGERYAYATLNDDGSVTYLMTKDQLEAMKDYLKDSVDDQLSDMKGNKNYAIKSVKYNDDLSEFKVYLSDDEVGFYQNLALSGFYTYGGLYRCFTGSGKKTVVKFYDSDGNLLETDDSSGRDS